jgi:hypothetical protein
MRDERRGVRSLDIEALRQTAVRSRESFASAVPFPHLVLDDLLYPDAAEALVDEFDVLADGWTYYHHVNEKKIAFNDVARLRPAARAVLADLQSAEFLHAVELLTGVAGLLADPDIDGGGLQQTAPGGFLNVHTDFLAHTTRRHWSRQINLLLFLNRDWDESYKGWLELWEPGLARCGRRIAPLFNRCVIFRTTERSFHGVPAGVACPPGRTRKSLALYYFRDEGRLCRLHPTRYVPLPGDPRAKRALIHLDRWLLHAYSVLKRYTPLGDRIASSILKQISR